MMCVCVGGKIQLMLLKTELLDEAIIAFLLNANKFYLNVAAFRLQCLLVTLRLQANRSCAEFSNVIKIPMLSCIEMR